MTRRRFYFPSERTKERRLAAEAVRLLTPKRRTKGDVLREHIEASLGTNLRAFWAKPNAEATRKAIADAVAGVPGVVKVEVDEAARTVRASVRVPLVVDHIVLTLGPTDDAPALSVAEPGVPERVDGGEPAEPERRVDGGEVLRAK